MPIWLRTGTRSAGIADVAVARLNPRKTSQDFHTERAEKEKPLFRVSITNRDAW